MPLAKAVNLGRYHSGSNQSYINLEQRGIPQNSINQLRQMGYPIRYGSNYKYAYWGGVTAIEAHGSQLTGMIDKRRPGGKAAVG